MERNDILSAEELRKRLYLKFKHNGIFDNLRSQLREKLVSELDGNKTNCTPKTTKTSALLLQVLNWLVGDHLKTYEYNCTLSVFAAEIGTLNRTEEMFTLRDILQLLNVHSDYQDLITTKAGDGDTSLLYHILGALGVHVKRETNDNSCQTDSETISAAKSLRIKLQEVEDFYFLKKSASRMEFEGNVESQLVKYKKSVRDKMRKELQDDLARFKDHEILTVRLEEREKCRDELKAKMNQLEKEHREKSDEFVQREITARRHMNTIKESFERDCLDRRQEIFSQLDSARQQELEARRLADKMRLDVDLERSKLENEMEKLKVRESALKDKENSLDENVRQQVSRQRFEEREEVLERTKQLGQRELELENRRAEMELEREEARKVHQQSAQHVARVAQLHDEVGRLNDTNRVLEQENKLLSANTSRLANNETICAELETLKCQLRDVSSERDSLSLKIVSLNSQLTLPTSETWSLKRQLESERDNRALDRGLWDEQRRRFRAQLDAALDNNKTLATRIDEVVAVNAQLHSLVGNLRAELRHARLNLHDTTNFGHGDTFYDTSLDVARLAPELQLQLSSWTPPDARLAALEKETEYLHRKIQHIRAPPTWATKIAAKNDIKRDELFVSDQHVGTNLNSTMVDEADEADEAPPNETDKTDRVNEVAPTFDFERAKSTDTDVDVEVSDPTETEHKTENENNVNLDSLWEQRELNTRSNDISGANESQRDLDDW